MSRERVIMPHQTCESCGAVATVGLPDGSWWCEPCDDAANALGYDDPDPTDEDPRRGTDGEGDRDQKLDR